MMLWLVGTEWDGLTANCQIPIPFELQDGRGWVTKRAYGHGRHGRGRFCFFFSRAICPAMSFARSTSIREARVRDPLARTVERRRLRFFASLALIP